MSRPIHPVIPTRLGRLIATLTVVLVALGIMLGGTVVERGRAQTVTAPVQSAFRIGEKLSYTLSFGRLANAGYIETHVISRGKIGGKDAVEIRAKVKTLELMSAAFFMLDESRTVFAAPDTGLPLHITRTSQVGVLPKETVNNYLTEPTSNFDLLTLLYKARETGGVGTFPVSENEQFSTASFLTGSAERVKTEAGEFDTVVSTLQSEFLATMGIKNLTINFSVDQHHIPVLIRFKTARGDLRASLSGISMPEPEKPSLSSTPTPTPVVPVTPRPSPTPEVYVDNKPLAAELGFQLGELLDYRITAGGQPVAVISLNAKERKEVQKVDTLILTATITGVEQGSTDFRLGDAALAEVNAETLAPRATRTRFASAVAGLNQTLTFDGRTGMVTFGGAAPIDAPVGTHSIISLIYAMRSFNLKPSKDPNNPVNDTRVAIFWESKPYVFTLRPSAPQETTINGEKRSAQLITINTGNAQLDALALKVWLDTETRVPLRFAAGRFQAELISQTSNLSN